MKRLVAIALALLGAGGACHPNPPAVAASEVLDGKLLALTSASQDDDARSPRKNMGTADYHVSGSGSAFYIGDGRVLTAGHCLHDRAEVELRDREGKVHVATLARVDERLDLALLTPKTPLSEDLRLDLASRTPELGASVYVEGETGFGFPVLTHGSVAANVNGRFGESMGPLTLTNIAAWHGMSGAPLLSMDGGPRVVGVAVGFLDVNYVDPDRRGTLLGATPIESVDEFLEGRVAPAVRGYADYAAAQRAKPSPGDVVFTAKLASERSSKHRWFDLAFEIQAPSLEGDVVVLRPFVLDGTRVVGQGHPCFFMRTREEGATCSQVSGHLYAEHAGRYDVVLLAGATPIAFSSLDVAN